MLALVFPLAQPMHRASFIIRSGSFQYYYAFLVIKRRCFALFSWKKCKPGKVGGKQIVRLPFGAKEVYKICV